MQLLSVTEKSGSTLKLNLTDDSNQYRRLLLQPLPVELCAQGKRLHGATKLAENQDRLQWLPGYAGAAFRVS